MDDEISVYDTVGGMPFFVALVERFYRRVAKDIMLRPLYPDDLGPPSEHLTLFLVQYWGGPTTYSDDRGHPRLRMGHGHVPIVWSERHAWFPRMSASVVEADLPVDLERRLLDYFTMAADHLVNA